MNDYTYKGAHSDLDLFASFLKRDLFKFFS